ncbi:agmatine deiminase family protein [Embleya sp. MST-111070]|uniref:agmatine deiminase family protein n=1 Tax=Embleya sp. MST-111070 TaxID=3398231 RepID=UPI003F731DB4
MNWIMPAETDPQDRVWMAFPVEGYTLGDDPDSAEEARRAWAEVANTAAEFEPVTMVVDPSARAHAARLLSSEVDVVEAPLDDFWMRDFGPTFVLGEDGLAAVDWTFNAWGTAAGATWAKDAEIARFVAAQADVPVISSVLVNEGGGIHVDGEGTVLVTETVQLDPHRNPFADKARVEAELARTIGATHVIWLPRGLERDYSNTGTRGHVDILATIPSPGTLLVHQQRDPAHPDCEITRMIKEFLAGTHDAKGRSWNIIDLPAPSVLTDEVGFVDYSYVNHLVVNGGVLACGFRDEAADAEARDILAAAYPGRRIVTIDAVPIFTRGGGIHCITQQQPSVPA